MPQKNFTSLSLSPRLLGPVAKLTHAAPCHAMPCHRLTVQKHLARPFFAKKQTNKQNKQTHTRKQNKKKMSLKTCKNGISPQPHKGVPWQTQGHA